MKKNTVNRLFYVLTCSILLVVLLCQCTQTKSTSGINRKKNVVLKFARMSKMPTIPPFFSKDEILKKYNEYYNKLGFNNKDYEKIVKVLIEHDKDYKNLREPRIRFPRYDEEKDSVIIEVLGPAEMWFDAKDGRIRYLGNEVLLYYLEEIEPMPAEVKATKTEAEIIQLAEKYRQIIMGDFSKEMTYAKPKAKFHSYGMDVGKWEITWQRLINGYSVWADCIRIRIYDSLNLDLDGFSAFGAGLQYESCPTDVKINSEDAKKVAWATVDFIQREYYTYIKDLKFTLDKSELLIIAPNYLFDSRVKDWSVGFLENRTTRLAYRFDFLSENRDRLGIDIDAETGEVLGASLPK